MGGGGGSMESGEPEFQIAPMIDCLLVLLIFFMCVTTAEVLQIDKDITLPVAADAEKKEKSNTIPEGALNVKWALQKATYSFEGKTYDEVDPLVAELQDRKAKNAKYRVIIRADKNMPAIEVQRTMNLLGTAGIDDISFSALSK